MTFLDYCRNQRSRRSPVGDFARDWVADDERPRAPTFARMIEYLEDQGAIDPAILAAKRCYNEWRLFADG